MSPTHRLPAATSTRLSRPADDERKHAASLGRYRHRMPLSQQTGHFGEVLRIIQQHPYLVLFSSPSIQLFSTLYSARPYPPSGSRTERKASPDGIEGRSHDVLTIAIHSPSYSRFTLCHYRDSQVLIIAIVSRSESRLSEKLLPNKNSKCPQTA